MVTPALPGALIANEVIPAAQAVFAAYDEIPRLLGEGFDSTPLGALRALRHIRGLAPRAAAFITLGKDGVLASAPGGCECHIALCPGPSAAIQACVALDPARTNGAGDAFLAGAAAFYAEGASLVEGITQSSSNPTVAAGISACAAAVRWMGYQPTLTAGDFQTVDLTGERTPIAA
jgi:sugar/nucleoside kinase (ribokinase family)